MDIGGDVVSGVTVFSTASCPWCVKTKEHLDALSVRYESIDIGEDREGAREVIEQTHQRGVPVTRIGDTYIVGFDPDAIDEALREERIL